MITIVIGNNNDDDNNNSNNNNNNNNNNNIINKTIFLFLLRYKTTLKYLQFKITKKAFMLTMIFTIQVFCPRKDAITNTTSFHG